MGEKILDIEQAGGGYEEMKEYISGEANKKYIHEGLVDQGYGWAGQAIGLIHKVVSVEELIQSLISEAAGIRKKWGVK